MPLRWCHGPGTASSPEHRRQDGGGRGGEHGDRRNDDAVEHPVQQIPLSNGIPEVLQRRVQGWQKLAAEVLLPALERGNNHVIDGIATTLIAISTA